MSQGKEKTKITLCILQNPAQHPGCMIPPRKAAVALISRLSKSHFAFKQWTVEGTQTGLWTVVLNMLNRILLLFDWHGQWHGGGGQLLKLYSQVGVWYLGACAQNLFLPALWVDILLRILIHAFTGNLLYLFDADSFIKAISLGFVITPLKMYCCGSFEVVAKYSFFFF